MVCNHCLKRKQSHPTKFNLDDCEAAVAKRETTLKCGEQSVALDSLVPDVLLKDLDSACIILSEELEIDDKVALGTGSYGKVYCGEWRGTPVAIKELHVGDDSSNVSRSYRDFRQEVTPPPPNNIELIQICLFHFIQLWMLSGLNHPNIVQLKGFTVSPLRIVMEFIPLGSLMEFYENKSIQMDHRMQLQICLDVAKGMEFLHALSPPIIHCGTLFPPTLLIEIHPSFKDLKSPNVMVVNANPIRGVMVKIIDFGQSLKAHIDAARNREKVDTPTWLAPVLIPFPPFLP